jgi:membrane fusion protein (multidrug efflux system)
MAGRKPDPGKRAQILRAATEVFSAREFHTVPVDDVAAAAGVGKGTLYLYFPTKEQLFYATIIDAFDALTAELEEAVRGRQGEEALRAFVTRMLEFFWRRRPLAVLMHRYEHKRFDPEGEEWRARRLRIVELVRGIVHREVRAERLATADVSLATEMLLGLVRAAVLNHDDSDRPERAASFVTDLFLHGLGRRPGTESPRPRPDAEKTVEVAHGILHRSRQNRRLGASGGRVRILVPLLFLAATLAAGCSHGTTTAEETKPEAEPVSVAVVDVTKATVPRSAPLVGAFFANEEVTIAAQIEARVQELHYDMGDRVQKGDVLLRLDDAEFRALLREVEARVAKARADNARAQVLRGQGIMANEEADRLRTEAAIYEAQRDVLEVKIDRTIIRAPLTGSIAARTVGIGEIVSSGRPLFKLVQDDPLKFRTPIPERFAGFLKLGQAIHVGVDAYPGRDFTGEITRINPTSESANRSITIEALVPNPEGLLKPGFFAKGDLVYDQHGEAIVVPQRALTTFAGVSKLFVVKDGKAEERVVRVGAEVPGDRVEIVDGVAAGEQVAVSNIERLEHGLPVTVTGDTVAAEQ